MHDPLTGQQAWYRPLSSVLYEQLYYCMVVLDLEVTVVVNTSVVHRAAICCVVCLTHLGRVTLTSPEEMISTDFPQNLFFHL